MTDDESRLLRDALTDRMAAAIGLHEMYESFQSAGFTNREALEFCLTAFREAVRAGMADKSNPGKP